MNITSISVQDFLTFYGTHQITLAPGMNIVTGPNGSGKSSVLEAIQFTFFGGRGRIEDMRKNHALVNIDAKSEEDDKEAYAALKINGDWAKRYIMSRSSESVPPKLTKNTQLMIATGELKYEDMKADERSRLLFSLCRNRPDGRTLVANLLEKLQCQAVSDAVVKQFKLGVGAASKYAKEQVKEYKAMYQAMTGDKFEETMPVPDFGKAEDIMKKMAELLPVLVEHCPCCDKPLRRPADTAIPLTPYLDNEESHAVYDTNAYKALQKQLDRALGAKSLSERIVQLRKEYEDWKTVAAELSPKGAFKAGIDEVVAEINEIAPDIEIDSYDYSILSNGRRFRLLSESEKWTASTQMQEAVARISGLGVLCVDSFDHLQLKNRQQALSWLYRLRGEYKTMIVSGPIPAKGLPADINVIELPLVNQEENGNESSSDT